MADRPMPGNINPSFPSRLDATLETALCRCKARRGVLSARSLFLLVPVIFLSLRARSITALLHEHLPGQKLRRIMRDDLELVDLGERCVIEDLTNV